MDGKQMRRSMDAALKKLVVPNLRNRGFSGAHPHFRRILSDRVDLLSFQFHKAGGSFVAEIGSCPPTGVLLSGTMLIPPEKVDVSYTHAGKRLRLGSQGRFGDHWFVFGNPNYLPADAGEDKLAAHYEEIAAAVAALIDSQAEPFWRAVGDAS